MFNDRHGVIATGAALVAFAASATTNPAPGQLPEASHEIPRPVNVSLTSFDVYPETIHLKAGVPIMLRVANDSDIGHDLTAPEFFNAAAISAGDAVNVVAGKIALSPHRNVIIAMIPAAGRYSMKCSHALHKMLGMSGTIVVDS
jgi:plastocyanin